MSRSPPKAQHEHSNFLKTAVRHVKTVHLRTRKSRMPREKKHHKQDAKLSEQYPKFAPVTPRHRKTHMCSFLHNIHNTSKEANSLYGRWYEIGTPVFTLVSHYKMRHRFDDVNVPAFPAVHTSPG